MNEKKRWTLDDWSIEEALFEEICKNIPSGSTILELGSGAATDALSDAGYTMFSIEDNPDYLNKRKTTYIHAPLKRFGPYEWYDIPKETVFPKYSFLLIDGPGYWSRREMVNHIHLFDTSVRMAVDDCQMNECVELADALGKIAQRPGMYITGKSKRWAII